MIILIKILKRLFLKPKGTEYRPPTFMNRVMTLVTSHLVLALLTGTLGVWGILKGIGMLLAIPAALLLWALGGKPDLPWFAKEDANKAVSTMDEYFKHVERPEIDKAMDAIFDDKGNIRS